MKGYVTELEDMGNARVRLKASGMPLKKWLYWLERLSKEIGVTVIAATIQAQGEGVALIEATLAPLGTRLEETEKN